MKTIEEKTMESKEVKKTMYEAFDGEKFCSQDMCRDYERGKFVSIAKHLDSMEKKWINLQDEWIPYACCGDDYGCIICPKTIEDIKFINDLRGYMGHSRENPFGEDYLGKHFVIELGCDACGDNGYDWLGSSEYLTLYVLEELINDSKERYANLINGFDDGKTTLKY